MMTTIRTFIAIDLPDEVRHAVTELQNRLKGKVPPQPMRWVNPQTMHLTLHFLGEVPRQAIADITTALHKAVGKQPAFQLTLTGLGCFPKLQPSRVVHPGRVVHRPRVVWLGVGGDTTRLIQLHSTLGQQLAQHIGFEAESRPYTPHLTLGRVRKGIPPRQLRQLGPIFEQEQTHIGQVVSFPVSDIYLYQSELTPKGPIYTLLTTVRLTG